MEKAAQTELRLADVSNTHELVGLLSATFEEAYDGVHSPDNIRAYCESNYSVDEVRVLFKRPA
jgi:hypothetical protein